MGKQALFHGVSPQHALTLQVQQKVEHNMKRVLPNLYGIFNDIQAECRVSIDSSLVSEFTNILHKLTQSLESQMVKSSTDIYHRLNYP